MSRESRRSPAQEQQFHDDAKLIDDIRSGDRTRFDAAWKELYKRYFHRVAAGMSGFVHDRVKAEEITQHAFVKAAQCIDTFEAGSLFFTWVFTIAKHLAIDEARMTQRRKTGSLNDAEGMERHRQLIDTRLNPEEVTAQQDTNALVQRALEALSPIHAEVLRMREFEGLSYREMAERLGIPEGTVMSRLFYARGLLKDGLEREMANPSMGGRKARASKVEVVPHPPVMTDEEVIAKLQAYIDSEYGQAKAGLATASARVEKARAALEEANQ